MPTRRTLLTTATAGLAGVVVPPATARPTTERSDTTTDVDVMRAIDTVAVVSDRVSGHLDFEAVETLRATDLEAIDRRTAADLDRRLAPVLGRGPSRVAGLQTLAGELDAGAAARRLGPGVSSEGTRLLADLALDGDASSPVNRDAFDADAVTAVTVADDELGSVESFTLAVDVDGAFRARVSGDGVSVADARGALRSLGLPTALVDGLTPAARDDWVGFDGTFESRDGEQPFIVALLLVLLIAVIGTFVLGLGDSVEQRTPTASFSFRYDDGGPVTVVHRGGDSIRAGTLTVVYTVRGREPAESWPDTDGDGFVEAGDSYTTEQAPDSGTTVRVVWQSPDGNTSATLGVSEVP